MARLAYFHNYTFQATETSRASVVHAKILLVLAREEHTFIMPEFPNYSTSLISLDTSSLVRCCILSVSNHHKHVTVLAVAVELLLCTLAFFLFLEVVLLVKKRNGPSDALSISIPNFGTNMTKVKAQGQFLCLSHL